MQNDFSAAFGSALTALGDRDERICAVTAAMTDGTGLSSFAQAFPKRFYDVGIAEGHAAAMCAGMARSGSVPVFAVYSCFLQRSFDQLIHDVALQGLHVVLGVDRAGLVGRDGETHNGLFDVSYLSTVPGMTVLCPSSFAELREMISYAVLECSGPVAVRYPRGGEGAYRDSAGVTGSLVLREGRDLTMVGYGTLINQIVDAAHLLEERHIHPEVVKLNSITPLDCDTVAASVQKTGRLLVAEDVMAYHSVGQRLAASLVQRGVCPRAIRLCSLGEVPIPHGTVSQLLARCGLDARGIFEQGLEACAYG